MKCLYCPGTDFLGISVSKAYRRGGSSYTREDGDYWILDEFYNLGDTAAGIINAGDVDLEVCLDCYRIQKFEPTPEQKQAIIETHIKNGHNPRQREREKRAKKEANKEERESRQHLYDEWSKGQPEKPIKPEIFGLGLLGDKPKYCLYLFYEKDDQKLLDSQRQLAASLPKMMVILLEWSSTAAFKPKIRYHINSTQQCVLTDKRGGDIVRLSKIPDDPAHLASMLNSLGYRREAEEIVG
jgi:hypothetical protein